MDQQGENASQKGGPILSIPDVVWGPLAVASLLGAVGLIGLAVGQPLLIPSLGPTAFLQAEEPRAPSARFYNTVVGHLVGLAAGMAAVLLLGASDAPSVLADKEMVQVRVGAAVLSGALTMLGLSLLRASHPPAAATMLLVSLGGIGTSWRGVGVFAVGVLIVAILGEGVRFLRREVFPPPGPSPG